MKKTPIYIAILLLALFFILTSCGKDEDPVIPNEEELITTLILTLSTDGANPVALSFRDIDGDGGNAPEIMTAALKANTTYRGSLRFLNELTNPATEITDEVAEEDTEHQIFYIVENTGLSITYDDTDQDGNPIGLSTIFNTGSAGTNKLTVIMRHEPDKFAAGVSAGSITNAGGETDIEVEFDILVE